MKKIHIISLFVLPLLVFSCRKDEYHFDNGHQYFGLKKGNYIEYNVTEIFHDDPVLVHDTINYQLRTEIGDTVIDNEGKIANKFFRYIRSNPSESWQLKDVWTTVIRENKGQLVEENQRVNKLHFPVRYGEKWNMNTFNMDGNREVSYRDVHKKITYNGEVFDSTLKVFEQNYKTLIDHRIKYEIYAKGVGLIVKYYKDLDIMNFDSLSPRLGTEIFYKMYDYGKL